MSRPDETAATAMTKEQLRDALGRAVEGTPEYDRLLAQLLGRYPGRGERPRWTG